MTDGSHQTTAPDAFAKRAQEAHGESIRHLVVFGSAVSDGDREIRTEMDVLLVLEDGDSERERQLRRLARAIGLEHGVVATVHVLPVDRFEAADEHPFVESAFADGTVYV